MLCSELRASKIALSPMTRPVAEAEDRQQALYQAQHEVAACKGRLQELEQAHAAHLFRADDQRQECFTVRLSTVTMFVAQQLLMLKVGCKMLTARAKQG